MYERKNKVKSVYPALYTIPSIAKVHTQNTHRIAIRSHCNSNLKTNNQQTKTHNLTISTKSNTHLEAGIGKAGGHDIKVPLVVMFPHPHPFLLLVF